MKARVFVTLKSAVLDPQGKAVESALSGLGLEGISSVRQGKIFDIELETQSKEEAKQTLTMACEKLLANLVIENFDITLSD